MLIMTYQVNQVTNLYVLYKTFFKNVKLFSTILKII